MLLFSLGSQKALFNLRHVPLGGRGSLEGIDHNPVNNSMKHQRGPNKS